MAGVEVRQRLTSCQEGRGRARRRRRLFLVFVILILPCECLALASVSGGGGGGSGSGSWSSRRRGERGRVSMRSTRYLLLELAADDEGDEGTRVAFVEESATRREGDWHCDTRDDRGDPILIHTHLQQPAGLVLFGAAAARPCGSGWPLRAPRKRVTSRAADELRQRPLKRKRQLGAHCIQKGVS